MNKMVSFTQFLPQLATSNRLGKYGFILALTATSLAHTLHVWAEEPSPKTGKAVNSSVEATPILSGDEQPAQALGEPIQEELEAPQLDAEGKPITARAAVVDIVSNTMHYDEKNNVITATGKVKVTISEQNSELFADKVTLDQNRNLLFADGHVVITKNGQRTEGVYAKIDMSRQSALINNATIPLKAVRVKAQTAFVDPDYTLMENGKLIFSRELLSKMRGNGVQKPKSSTTQQAQVAKADPKSRNAKGAKADARKGAKGSAAQEENIPNSYDLAQLSAGAEEAHVEQLTAQTLDLRETTTTQPKQSNFHLKTREINIEQGTDGINNIEILQPSLYWKKFKIAGMAQTEAAYNQNSQELEYLGPDIGYDPDYGGFYYGPGWDFRAGKTGFVRLSPMASFGGGGRRIRGGRQFEDLGTGLGAGIIGHYRDPKTRVDFGINSRVGQPVLYSERKLFDGKTRLMATINEDYTNGFLGFERPGAMVQITDTRKIAEMGNFRVRSFGSLGVGRDDLFPLNTAENFVDTSGFDGPVTAGRAQLQLELSNVKPLLRFGKTLDFGLTGQAGMAGYTTGDLVGIARIGPRANLHLFNNRYNANAQFFFVGNFGETPFVFDTYYQGRQNLILNHNFRVNQYLTLGAWHDMNLNRENAQNSMFVGNALYAMVGPKSVKFQLAFDFIRRRSYFGIKFYPSGGDTTVDFDKMRVFQPVNY